MRQFLRELDAIGTVIVKAVLVVVAGVGCGLPVLLVVFGMSYFMGLFFFGEGKGAVIFGLALPAFFVYAIYVSSKQ